MPIDAPDYTANSHVVQEAYVRQWALKRQVVCHNVQTGESGLARTKDVCVERDFFEEFDAEGNRVSPMEQRMQRLETLGIEAVRRLRKTEELGIKDRALLARYVALHAVRGHAWRDVAEDIREPLRRRKLEETAWSHPEAARRFEQHCSTAAFRHEVLVDQAIQLTALLGSMHWTVLRFKSPDLILGDHPVGLHL